MAGAREPVAIRKRRRPAAPKDKGQTFEVSAELQLDVEVHESQRYRRLRRALYLRQQENLSNPQQTQERVVIVNPPQ